MWKPLIISGFASNLNASYQPNTSRPIIIMNRWRRRHPRREKLRPGWRRPCVRGGAVTPLSAPPCDQSFILTWTASRYRFQMPPGAGRSPHWFCCSISRVDAIRKRSPQGVATRTSLYSSSGGLPWRRHDESREQAGEAGRAQRHERLCRCRHCRFRSPIASWLTQSRGNTVQSARLTRPGSEVMLCLIPPSWCTRTPPVCSTTALNCGAWWARGLAANPQKSPAFNCCLASCKYDPTTTFCA